MISAPAMATPRSIFTFAAALISGVGLAVLTGITASPLSILVVGSLGAVLAMLMVPPIATLAFLFLLYINAPAVLVNFHGLPFFVGAAFIGLLGIPTISLIMRRDSIIFPPIVVLVTIYICILAVSSLVAPHFAPAWATLLVHVQEGFVPVLLLMNFIRTPAMLRAAIWALLLAGLFMGGLSVHQELTGSYGDSYGGFAQIVGRGFSPEGGELGERVLRPRLAGPIHEQNRYAQVMLVLVPLAIGTMLVEKRRALRLLAAAAGFLSLAAVLLSFSRGAAIVLVGLLVAAMALRHVRLRTAIPLVAFALIAVLLVAPDFGARIASLPEVTEALTEGRATTDLSILGRITLNLAAFQMFVEHPVLGVGLANFDLLSVDYANPLGLRHISLPYRAHNLYLEVAAETGVLGLASFLGLLGYVLWQLWRCRREAMRISHTEHARMATALLYGLFAYLGTALFLHMAYERYFWILIALCGSAAYVIRTDLANRASLHAGEGPLRDGEPKNRLLNQGTPDVPS